MIIYRIAKLRGIVRRAQSIALLATPRFEFERPPAVYGWPVLSCVHGARVFIGAGLTLISEDVFSEVGVSHACVIRALRPGARMEIGADVGMSGATVCCAESVRIGNRVMLGADCVVADTDFHAIHSVPRRHVTENIATSPVVVEDDVFVGMRAIILKGVTVGRGAVVGANSVVTHDVPGYAIVAGSPARTVGWVGESAPGADAFGRCKRTGRP
jgi:acetyltransferase-like isoleucine patch superfamily enzyme